MKVIGAGYTRTGTVSLKTALETLGVGPCLHPLTAPETERVLERARDADATVDWHEDLGSWSAATGWVGARYYRELIEAWPASVVVLSVRDADAWYASYASCLRATAELAASGGPELASAVAAAMNGLMMADQPLRGGLLDASHERREEALARYQRHNEAVARAVPIDRLLVYDIEDGWEPLCDFLDLPVPDLPFPHLNDRAEFRARLAPLRRQLAPRPVLRGATPRLSGLALAKPEQSFGQQEVLEALGMAHDPFAQRIFESCGVKRRHLTLLHEHANQTLQGRTTAAEAHMFELAVRAVEALAVDPQELDTVITSSLYSLGGPTLAHRLVERFAMDPATDKYHIVGVGCASAVPLVRLMSKSLGEREGSKGLIVAAETMSGLLTQAAEDDPRAKVIGSAIFGDGCAAAIVEYGGDAPGPAVVASTVHQLPGTLDVVHMALGDQDSHLALAEALPELASAGLAALVDGFLAPLGLTRYAIDHWLIHPGGRRILERAQAALSLSDEDVRVSYEVLAAYGNIGTPSIFYVLDETVSRRAPARGDRGLMITVGPGVTVGLMLLVF